MELTDNNFPDELALQIKKAVSSGKVGRASAMLLDAGKAEGKPMPIPRP